MHTNMLRIFSSLLLLNLAVCDAATAAKSHHTKSAEHAKALKLISQLEAKLPPIPAYQRARGMHAWVGPPRKSDESRARAITHTQKLMKIQNAKHAMGESSYFMSWNPLSDLSDDEYRSFLKSRADDVTSMHHGRASKPGLHIKAKLSHGKEPSLSFTDANAWSSSSSSGEANDTTPLPKSWNWQDIEDGKYLTPIKNQGTCGSCWAFSAVSVIESRYAIDNNVAASPLSVEQVLSCSAPLDHIHSKFKDMVASSKGCDGGMPFLAFEYMSRVSPNGIACDSDYPYVMATQVLETQCQAVSTDNVAVAWQNGVSDYVPIEQQSEEALMRAVHHGPVSSNIDAMGAGFRNYGGGIYDAADCKSDGKEVNHAVVIVGYGETEQGQKYWVLRNTWGTMWGENGYMRIARGSASQPFGPCNMYTYSAYPTKLTKGSATTDGVCAAPQLAFQALGWIKLMGYDGGQWAILVGSSLGCVVLGMLFFALTELKKNKRDATGATTYEDNYDRWVLPSKDQIAAMLAKRRPQQTESV